MKKLLLVLLFVPLVSFGQTYSQEKPALIEKIKSWGEKQAFELYKELVQIVISFTVFHFQYCNTIF